MNPTVSVCIPSFNSANTILSTLQSVLNQTFTDIEIIVCDDHSTDNTADIVKQINDDRVKLIIGEKNIGLANNFHKALTLANGKYIKFLCADDLITPDCIEKQVRVFKHHSNDNIAMVISEKNVINKNGEILLKKKFPGKQGIHNGLRAIQKSISLGTNIFGEPGCVLVDREIACQTSGFLIEDSLTYVMDLNFYCRLLKNSNLYVLKEPLFSFRVSPSSATASFKWSQARIFCKLINKLEREIPINLLTRTIGKILAYIHCVARNLIFSLSR